MKARHIIQVTGYYPPHLGGVEQRVQDVSVRLAKKGKYKITVLSSNIGTTSGTFYMQDGLEVNYMKTYLVANTPLIPSLFRKICNSPPQSILHVHIAQSYIPEITFLASRLKKLPYIAHVRLDSQQTGLFGVLLPIYKKLVLGPVLRRATKVICLTPDYADLMQKKYGIPAGKVAVIPNGTNFTRSKYPKKLNPKRTLKFLFVGRLAVQKNVFMLLSAIKEYHEKNDKNFLLEIIGEGPEESGLKAFVKKNKMGFYVKFIGTKLGKELEKYYEKADVFLMTSREESFGTVIIEAMTKGLPVIATNILAVRNTVHDGENGLLVEPNSPTSVAEAINLLVNDKKLYSSLSENALKTSKSYEWPSVIRKIETVYENVSN